MNVCFLCKVRLRKNEGVLHILPSLPSGSNKVRLCDFCHLEFHKNSIVANSPYAQKYLNKLSRVVLHGN